MSLEIKKAHLKYAATLMAIPLDYPEFFFADANIFYYFFKRLDEKTANRIKKITKNEEIPRAYFGQMIIDMSKLDISIVADAPPNEKKAMRKFARNTFLNLAAWYICPLLEANRRMCPYMTFDWVKNFLNTANARNPADRRQYYDGIRAFISNARARNWKRALDDMAPQLGKDAETYILLFVGMFLAAYEEQKDQISLPPDYISGQDTPKRSRSNLNSQIVKFLQGIKEVDELPPRS